MAGELTASTPTLCANPTAVKTHIDTLTLATATDFLAVIPVGVSNSFLVFKIERAA